MSFEEDRIKRKTRIQNEQNAIKKQTRIAKSNGIDVKQPHKYAKHHAMDCGNPKCMLCGNPRKLYKEPTIQEESFKQTESWDE
jgi:hypothetical protein